MRKMLKVAKWASISFLLLFILMLTVSWTLLSTERGRIWLVQNAVVFANRSTEFYIEIGSIRSSKLGDWQISSLYLQKEELQQQEFEQKDLQEQEHQQKKQTLLNAKNLELRWQPRKLWKRQLVIDYLSMRSLTINTPKGESNKKKDTHNSSLPNLSTQALLQVNIKQLSIAKFDIHGISLGKRNKPLPTFAIDGDVNFLNPFSPKLNLKIQSVGEKTLKLSLSIEEKSSNKIVIEGTVQEDPGGLLGELLLLPKEQRIAADFETLVEKDNTHYAITLKKLSIPIVKHHLSITGLLELSDSINRGKLSDLRIEIDESVHTLQGYWQDEDFNLHLIANQFSIDITRPWQSHIHSGRLSADLKMTGKIASPIIEGELDLDTTYKNKPLSLQLIGKTNTKNADIKQLNGHWGKAKATGKGKLDWVSEHSDFFVTISEFNLEKLKPFGVVLPNKAQVTIRSAQAQIKDRAQNLQGHLTAIIDGKYAQQVFTINTKLSKPSDTVTIEQASLAVANSAITAQGELNIKTWLGKINLSADAIPLSLIALTGTALPEGLNAVAFGKVTVDGNLRQPAVYGKTEIKGDYQDVPFALQSKGHFQDKKVTIEALQIKTFDKPVLTLKGKLEQHNIDLKLEAKRLPTRLFSALGWHIKPGQFSANIKAQGPLELPNLEGTVRYGSRLSGFNADGDAQEINFIWDLSLDTQGGFYTAHSLFTRDNSPPGKVLIKIPQAPYRAYFQQKNTRHLSQIPLRALLTGQLSLQTISFLFDPELHRLSGIVDSEVKIDGTVTKPEVNGSLTLKNSRYENPMTGTIIDNIHCSLTAYQSEFRIQDCSASDGNSGRYQLMGKLRLPQKNDQGSILLSIKTDQANIIRRLDIESETTGEIQLSGDMRTILAKGTLEVAPLSAAIDAQQSSGIPKVEVKKVETITKDQNSEIEKNDRTPVVNIDLLITAGQQAFVRGRGLEAELQGQLRLRGTLDNPRYDGEFNTVRGDFDVFGKKFELERGKVNFANDTLGLNIEGVYRKKGQQIRAQLFGSSENLQLSLSAEPTMAEDQILAFIIFGKSVQTITPFEAIQLASAVQTLRGGGSGFIDPIGSAREILGVDSFSIESEDTKEGETGINVGVGKYLNENVYLELERTPNPSQPWKGNIEIELTPTINLESSTGGSAGIEGAEIKWKKDY